MEYALPAIAGRKGRTNSLKVVLRARQHVLQLGSTYMSTQQVKSTPSPSSFLSFFLTLLLFSNRGGERKSKSIDVSLLSPISRGSRCDAVEPFA